jgi:hypothetical protein
MDRGSNFFSPAKNSKKTFNNNNLKVKERLARNLHPRE